jgi:hypothetical protein
MFLTKLLDRATDYVIRSRPCAVAIGGREQPYLERWFVIPRNRFFNIYLHVVRRSDDDRALHDHPWWNMSWLLKGHYIEHTIAKGGVHYQERFEAGDKKFRLATAAHRLELDQNCWQGDIEVLPCKSLFITGPKLRDWGFHCIRGWVHWKQFTAFNTSGDSSVVGPGCGE